MQYQRGDPCLHATNEPRHLILPALIEYTLHSPRRYIPGCCRRRLGHCSLRRPTGLCTLSMCGNRKRMTRVKRCGVTGSGEDADIDEVLDLMSVV